MAEASGTMLSSMMRRMSFRKETHGKAKLTGGKAKVLAQGWLWKKAHGIVSAIAPWKKRHFVLTKSSDGVTTLTWYKYPKAKVSNSLNLTTMYEIKPLTGSSKDPYCFMVWDIKSEKRVMKLAALAGKEKDHSMWMEALCSACSMGKHHRLLRKSSSRIQLSTELDRLSERAALKGYLQKKAFGSLVGKWHRRYFVLDGIRLVYFKPMDGGGIEDSSQNQFVLSKNSTVDEYDSDDGEEHCFKIEVDSGLLLLKANVRNDLQAWVDTINEAVLSIKAEHKNSATNTVKNGPLHLPREGGGGWAQRFAVLEGGALSLYKDDTLTKLTGSFDLSNCEALAQADDAPRPKGAPAGGAFFCFENPAWRDLSRHVRAPTTAIMWQWVGAIKAAVARRKLEAEEHSAFNGKPPGSPDYWQRSRSSNNFLLSASIDDNINSKTIKKMLLNFCCGTKDKHDVGKMMLQKALGFDKGSRPSVHVLTFDKEEDDEQADNWDVFTQSDDATAQIYMLVTFQGRQWIVCRSAAETLDFVNDAHVMALGKEQQQQQQQGGRRGSVRGGRPVGGRPMSTRMSSRDSDLGWKQQETMVHDLKSVLKRVLGAALQDGISPKASLLVYYYLELVPKPLLPSSTEALLLAEATGDESVGNDVVSVISNSSNLFNDAGIQQKALAYTTELLRAVICEVSPGPSPNMRLKVWSAVEDAGPSDAVGGGEASPTAAKQVPRVWWLVEHRASQLEAIGSRVASFGLPVPAFPQPHSRPRQALAAAKAFGNGDLAARLMKMWFDELPTKLMQSVQSDTLQIAHLDPKDTAAIDEAAAKIILKDLKEPNRSILLWLLDLCAEVAAEIATTLMDFHNLSVVITTNIFDMTCGTTDPMAALRMVQGSVKALERLCDWRQRARAAEPPPPPPPSTASPSPPGDATASPVDPGRAFIDGDQFGLPLKSVTCERVAGYRSSIPSLLVRLREVLIASGGLKKNGIFRVSPHAEDVPKVRRRIANGELFGGSLTWQRQMQQYVDKIVKHYYGLPEVLDFFGVRADSPGRVRLERLFRLSMACHVTHSTHHVVGHLHGFHDWELKYSKQTPQRLTDAASKVVDHIMDDVQTLLDDRSLAAGQSSPPGGRAAWAQLWKELLTLQTALQESDVAKTKGQITLERIGLAMIRGSASRPSIASMPMPADLAMTASASGAVHLSGPKCVVTALRSLSVLRVLAQQMKTWKEVKMARRTRMRDREERLRVGRKEPTNVEVTQFMMQHMLSTTGPWSWVTELILIGTMPIESRLGHVQKLIQECASPVTSNSYVHIATGYASTIKHTDSRDKDSSLSLVVAVATEEELAGLHSVFLPASRQDWEENGVETVRLTLEDEAMSKAANVSKSKKQMAASWASQLSRAVNKMHECVLLKNLVYVHDTSEETGQAWVVVMSYLVTRGGLTFEVAASLLQQKRGRIKPTVHQRQKVRAFSSFFKSCNSTDGSTATATDSSAAAGAPHRSPSGHCQL